jgi:hypothetical protein
MYYDYGNNITYQGNDVYVNGQNVGTGEEYYDQAASLSGSGAKASAPADGDWLPLGVFALTKTDQSSSAVSIQLAMNHDGVIRGNYTDTATDKTQQVHGSVDKTTQRVAFTVGDNTTNVVLGAFTVPAGFVVLSVLAVSTVLGASMTYNVGDSALGARILSAAAGSAVTPVTAIVSTSLLYKYPAETEIQITINLQGTGQPAGTIALYLTGFIDN